jgi:hypothetical protein
MWARQLAAALRHAASTRTQHTQRVHASSMATHSVRPNTPDRPDENAFSSPRSQQRPPKWHRGAGRAHCCKCVDTMAAIPFIKWDERSRRFAVDERAAAYLSGFDGRVGGCLIERVPHMRQRQLEELGQRIVPLDLGTGYWLAVHCVYVFACISAVPCPHRTLYAKFVPHTRCLLSSRHYRGWPLPHRQVVPYEPTGWRRGRVHLVQRWPHCGVQHEGHLAVRRGREGPHGRWGRDRHVADGQRRAGRYGQGARRSGAGVR